MYFLSPGVAMCELSLAFIQETKRICLYNFTPNDTYKLIPPAQMSWMGNLSIFWTRL